jgi:hypothetical protein
MSESRGMYVFEPNMNEGLREEKRENAEQKIQNSALMSFRVPNQSQYNLKVEKE